METMMMTVRREKMADDDAKKLRKEAKAVKQALNSTNLTEEFDNLFDLLELFAEEGSSLINMAKEKALKDLDAPPVQQAPLCITAANLQAPLELKSGLIHLLPKFRALANEDPYNHLKEFHVVCSSMKPDRITEE
ncbi:DNA-directed DNA polymerase [Senna tora]|uniref:DNA-directed DNA polymerase n=1 Tax=Senna tora TaxID=362788 RepID=A0A834X045_9FABA|nr:DNA-directed DNA polymerase [Senna tora]